MSLPPSALPEKLQMETERSALRSQNVTETLKAEMELEDCPQNTTAIKA
jgi:hypothetical protein